ncbi:MAG: hypothetical protein M9945_05110 [Aquamicrobium sp.]|uniref:hypothetical protein n=1 Tax=Aquamicrobium sp. TaxID=1872579 RepID=UPI00349E8BCE|nr:hypothetical protein [Aquamicrobium sp.]
MHIISIRPERSGGNTLARFDVQLDGMRLFNLALKRTANGYRVFAPSAFGGAVVTFTPETSAALVALATGEMHHYDRRAA